MHLTPKAADFCRRAEALLGGYGWKRRFADAMESQYTHVVAVTNGSRPLPKPWMPVLELLEKLPPDQWPLRWQK